MKIAILFGDNDFHSTFFGVLTILFDAFKYTGLTENKDKLCFLINNLSPIIYISHQNQWEYNGLELINASDTLNSKEFLHTYKYLQIIPDKILLNKEVDDYIKNDNFFNGETFILDTTLHNNNIYSL